MAATKTDATITLRLAAACGLLGEYNASSSAAAPHHQPAALVGTNDDNAAQQLTIFYGGTAVVLDGCTPERAAQLVGLAAAAPAPALVGTPIARNASLRRFLSKRKDRAAADPESEPPAKKGKMPELTREDAGCWLALGCLAWDDTCTRRL